MVSPFHIFKAQGGGSRRWVEAAANLEDAKARVKVLASSSPGEYVITNLTGDEISIKSQPKRIMFQIGYDEKELNVRAELFRRFGHEVISAPDNETAKRVLTSTHNVDVFVVGYQAPDKTRKEMVDWLKENFPLQRREIETHAIETNRNRWRGAAHGLPITHAEQLNSDLLAFAKS